MPRTRTPTFALRCEGLADVAVAESDAGGLVLTPADGSTLKWQRRVVEKFVSRRS